LPTLRSETLNPQMPRYPPDSTPRIWPGELDPRQPNFHSTSEHAQLTELRKAEVRGILALSTATEVRQINATADEQISELWEFCYAERLEPFPAMSLEEMTPVRRAKVKSGESSSLQLMWT
jgi:hypothetical protein